MKIVLLKLLAFSLCITAGLEIMRLGNRLLSAMPQELVGQLGMVVNNLVIAFFLAGVVSIFVPADANIRHR